MNSNLFSALGVSAGSNVPLAMLLTKATIILLLALGMTVVMQRASAGARHLVGPGRVAALLFVPALTAWGPLPVRVLPALASVGNQSSSIVGSKSQGKKSIDGGKTGITGPSHPRIVTPPEDGATAVISESGLKTGFSILLLIWAAVMTVIAVSLAYAAFAVRRIVKRARPLDTTDWLNPLWELSDRP